MSKISLSEMSMMIEALALQEPPQVRVLAGERPPKQKQPTQCKYKANKHNKKLKRKKI